MRALNEQQDRIDVVYTWVDDRFPGYAELLRQYAQGGHDLNPNRTRDNLDLLKYSLRSLRRYAPWVGQIYLLTCRPQVPEWLDPQAPGLTIVHHDQIVEQRHLPTFNSFAINSHLHLIEGLADRFLYIEDDMMFGNAVGPEDLWHADGAVRLFPRLPRTTAPEQRRNEAISPWNRALAQCNYLLDQAFGQRRRRFVNHVVLAIDRPVWREMLERWPAEVERTRASRFRATGNLAFEYLYPYYAFHTGRARMQSFPHTYATAFYHGLENNRLIALYGRAMIRLLRPKLLALNDNFDDAPMPAVVAATRRFLEELFPEPSAFER